MITIQHASPMIDPASKAATLSAALPYLRRYAGKTVVVKYGGHAMGDTATADLFARDVVLLKQVGINPIVVHGGGPQIGTLLERLGVESRFIDGLRVTDRATMEVVEMVLAGSINKQIVAAINRAGGLAVGLSGKDANLIRARKLDHPKDLGFVGEPRQINTTVLETLERSAIIPVIAPVGVGDEGESYNINADTAAGAIAAAVRATRFLLLTDVAGVLDRDQKLVSVLSADAARVLIKDGTIK
ncbi:MAG TPA: acetylglutamate kinase, partial [Stellaceae bacterium]|nr:acetylglutamate kinase [Stellaceae bacterium]